MTKLKRMRDYTTLAKCSCGDCNGACNYRYARNSLSLALGNCNLLSLSLTLLRSLSLSLCSWLISSATTTDFLAVSRHCCSCFAYCCYCYCSFVVILSNYLVLFTCVCTMRRRRLLRTRAEDGLKHEAHCGYEVTRVWVTRKDSPQGTRFVFEWVFFLSPVPCWWCKSRRL